MNAYDFLLEHYIRPAAIAVLDERDRPWTYQQLDTHASHLAGYLDSTTDEQDRCLIFADNGLFWLCAYLACLRAGRIVVPVTPDCSDEALTHILRDTSPTMAFVGTSRLRQFRKLADKFVTVVCEEDAEGSESLCWTEAAALVPPDISAAITNDTIAAIVYSGDGSSDARGAVWSHGSLAEACAALREQLALRDSDKTLPALSLADPFGITSALSALHAGGSVLLSGLPLLADQALSRMDRLGCTGICSDSGTFQTLLSQHGFSASDLPTLRFIEHVGNKPAAGLVARLKQSFPDAAVHVMYGMAEAGGALTAVPPELAVTKSSSAGEPLPGVRIQVLDEYGHVLPPGQTGEITAESPAIAVGYWRAPEHSQQTFRKGRLYTGDLGTIDADGALQVVGRAEDFLRLGGVPVTTSQIEQAISLFPGLQDQAVLSRHDDILSDSVVLVAVHPRGEEVRQQLLDFCASQLPFSQRPRTVLFRSHLPRDHAGHVDRRALQEQIELEHYAIPPSSDNLQAQQDPLRA